MRLIYVDDEQPALENFRWTTAGFSEIRSLEMFRDPQSAIDWVRENPVDAAFLDIEIPGGGGIELSRRLCELNPKLRIVFVTAYHQYAMDAWSTEAVGYILKPYTSEDIRKQLERIARYRPKPAHRVEIRTIPTLSVMVDGNPLPLSRSKVRELFALLVERGKGGITSGEGISCLWPERPGGKDTQSLFRVTYKRLADTLQEAGVGHILSSVGNRRALLTEQVDCDLYRILDGDEQAAKLYDGQYLQEYSWAEDRNGQLYRMLLEKKEK